MERSSGRIAIRPAQPGDAAAIAAVYNAGIAGRGATFETREKSAADVGGWFEDPLPLLVAVDGEAGVVGWARATPYSTHDYYSGVAEASVYIDPAHRGRGTGSALMAALAAAAERAGIYKLIGKLFTGHEISRALVARHGFREVGTHLRHGRLDGEWRDVLLVELPLGDAAPGQGAG
ncbi:MAG TPA: arsinothricin resistance N-acetyltransferase ArsN1 family A [Solirubrobacterales bacterium]